MAQGVEVGGITRLKETSAQTEEEWKNTNPILKWGTMALALDTGVIKVGDGIRAYNDLPPVSYNREKEVLVKSVEDLPEPVNGEHILLDDVMYQFNGFITTPHTLKLGNNCSLVGRDLGKDGIIYTGFDVAVRADNVPFFAREFVIVSPAAQALDLKADIDKEFYAKLVGIYNTPFLGVIDGYRVPSLKEWNCEDFDEGLVFTGESEKIFIDGSPFRGVGENSTIISFDENFSTTSIDITGNYFKDLEEGAVCVKKHPSATISFFGLLRGNSFEDLEEVSITEGFGPETVGWAFINNSGVRDSRILGEYSMAGNETVTTLTQNTWVKIAGTTVPGYLERFDATTSNRLIYIAERSTEALMIGSVSIRGESNDQRVEVAFFRNGEIESSPISTILGGPAQARADNLSINQITELNTDDYVEVWIRCTSSNDNVTVSSMQVSLKG